MKNPKTIKCPLCDGTGEIIICGTCKGTGIIVENKNTMNECSSGKKCPHCPGPNTSEY